LDRPGALHLATRPIAGDLVRHGRASASSPRRL
jgi:hypothetical protein